MRGWRLKAVETARGRLVTFEGGEGSGKTTQCRLLAEWLAQQGRAVTVVREPGGTAFGERVRQVLLAPGTGACCPEAEVMLFAAARAQAVSEVIIPALERGEVVLADRFVDSSLAYQGYGLGAALATIRAANALVTRGIQPVLTLLLDVPPELGEIRRRTSARGADRIERRGVAYHDAVRRGYLELARAEAHRFVVIDGTAAVDAVQANVRRAVAQILEAMDIAK